MFVFFFQAEDGIRDIGVTGVQTCALPIYRRLVLLALADHDDAVHRDAVDHQPHRVDGGLVGSDLVAAADPPARGERGGLRSEERRVGKECRSRWSPYP